MIIRNLINPSLAHRSTADLKQQVLAQHRRKARAKKGTPKTSTVAVYAGVFTLIIAVVAIGYRPPQETSTVANTAPVASNTDVSKTSVNDVVSTSIAANIAETTNLSVARNVADLSVSLSAKSDLSQSDSAVISKPQIVQPTGQNRAIVSYTAKAGDTIDTVATQYGVSKDTIKWANNLTSDALEPGKVLQVPPVTGVVYTVKDGDTLASIAEKYKVDQTQLVAYNDLELSGVSKDAKIILPGGVLPETERPGYVAPRTVYTNTAFSSGSNGSNSNNIYRASAGNRYSIGYCTWYVYERRAELGRPIGSFWGNASSWASSATSAGFLVDKNPEVGAIIQNGGGLGHVAIVEQILEDGTLVLSEMNYGGGWNVIHRGRTISAGQAKLYNYIH